MTPTPDPALAARLADCCGTALMANLYDGWRTCQLITLADHEAAVAKAVEACANEVILQYKLWEDYGAAGFDDLCIEVIPSAIRARKGDAL